VSPIVSIRMIGSIVVSCIVLLLDMIGSIVVGCVISVGFGVWFFVITWIR